MSDSISGKEIDYEGLISTKIESYFYRIFCKCVRCEGQKPDIEKLRRVNKKIETRFVEKVLWERKRTKPRELESKFKGAEKFH